MWPNSSDSSSVSGTPAQLIVTSGMWRRGLRSWMSRAAISLPTPLSPVIRTFAEERAAAVMSASRGFMQALEPTSGGEASGSGSVIGTARSSG